MARIILDPDEVNQSEHVTLTDGTVVALDEADAATLARIAEQLHIHRSTYAHALVDPAIGDRVAAGELDVAEHAPLHQAVQERLREARSGHQRREATDLAPGVLLQTRTWTSSGGATRLLVDLTPSHRRNLMGWLERNSEVLHQRAAAEWTNAQLESIEPRTPWVAGTPLYRRLEVKDSNFFLKQSKNPYATVARYTDEPFVGGHISAENLDKVRGTSALVAKEEGSGKVILFADNPNFRSYWHSTSRLFLNAIFFGQNLRL